MPRPLPSFDSFVLAALVAELQRDWVGARVQAVYQPLPTELRLELVGRAGPRMLLLSIHPRAARAHFVQGRKTNPPTPPAFCQLLRKRLGGARIAAVDQPGFDRILRLELHTASACHFLHVELMGRHSNVLLTDEGGRILGALKLVPLSLSRARPIRPGGEYVPPPGARRDPRCIPDGEWLAVAAAATEESLVGQLAGFGPFAAAEVFRRAARLAGGDATAGSVAEVLRELMDSVRRAAFAPVRLRDEAGAVRALWAFPTVQWPAERQDPVADLSRAVESLAEEAETSDRVEARRRELLAMVARHRERVERMQTRADEAQRWVSEAKRWRREAEAVAARVHEIAPESRVAEIADLSDPSLVHHIELEPGVSVGENVERLYRRARRAETAAREAAARAQSVASDAVRLVTIDAAIHSATGAELEVLAEEIHERGWEAGAPSAPAPAEKRLWPAGVRIRRYEYEGFTIFAGEDASSNDYLTTRVARPDDLWLHVRGGAGSHVVVRSPAANERVPRGVVDHAARIAAQHSPSRHSRLVAVDVTLRKHVRKPRRAAAGAVTISHERTVHVSPNGKR
jgi:predicted ribosome quality control (RQC) complex YloA/Tae2 family protein